MNFSSKAALNYYSTQLYTSIGLLRETPTSQTIFLANDQALDFNALRILYQETGNSSALALSNRINSSMQYYGGLYEPWNAVFILFEKNSSWAFLSGNSKPAFGTVLCYL